MQRMCDQQCGMTAVSIIDVTGMEFVSSTLIIGVSGAGSTIVDMTGTKPIDSLTSDTQSNVVYVVQSAGGGTYAVNG